MNPWKDIELSDYENHMSLDSVYQLQTLNQMMKEQFNDYPVKSIMVLGVAGGNGLEHIIADRLEHIYGVDINSQYLQTCEKRYPQIKSVLTTICADLTSDNLQLPNADLLVADLLIEYIGYKHFQNAVKLVVPKYVSCIIQINTDTEFVSDSPYQHVFDRLYEVHHQMEVIPLINAMSEIKFKPITQSKCELPNGKELVRIDFSR